MKKIIALALALIMALSMSVVAFAATPAAVEYTVVPNGANTWNAYIADYTFNPGEAYEINEAYLGGLEVSNYKVSIDFTNAAKGYNGASYIDEVKVTKEKDAIRLTLKESYTLALETAKEVYGVITLTNKTNKDDVKTIVVDMDVNNAVAPVVGEKKAANATLLVAGTDFGKNRVTVMDEDGGYVKFVVSDLTGVVKMGKEEKTYLNVAPLTGDDLDAFEEALGEDFDGIVETYNFETRAFKEEVAFSYDAYAEDPHYFYKWDGEKFTAIDAKYDDDEDVDDYVFTTIADETIVVSDVEIVAAAEEETKNPDTGANDVVGVAAALAVVSLVAAGAVSLKK